MQPGQCSMMTWLQEKTQQNYELAIYDAPQIQKGNLDQHQIPNHSYKISNEQA